MDVVQSIVLMAMKWSTLSFVRHCESCHQARLSGYLYHLPHKGLCKQWSQDAQRERVHYNGGVPRVCNSIWYGMAGLFSRATSISCSKHPEDVSTLEALTAKGNALLGTLPQQMFVLFLCRGWSLNFAPRTFLFAWVFKRSRIFCSKKN